MNKKMKQWVSLFLCVLMAFCLVSCRKNPATEPNEEPLTPTETLQVVSGAGEKHEYQDGDYAPVIKVTYPYVNLYGEDARTYPRLQLALEENNEKIRAEKLDFFNEVKKDPELSPEKNPDAPFSYQNTEKAYVHRADSKALSVLYSGYVFTGGAHGLPYFRTENYDTATGKLLKLSDVVTDTEVLPGVIMAQLDQVYPDMPWHKEIDMAQLLADDTIDWTLDYHGITFYFNAYDLTAYAYGCQQVTLIYSEFPNLVKREYQASPVAYGVELCENCNFYYDVNSDGVADTVSWRNQGEYEGMNEKTFITLNGVDYEFSEYSLENKATFLKTRTGEFYLYLENTMENDARETLIFRLGTAVEQTGRVQGGMHRHWPGKNEVYYVAEVLTDPDFFRMSIRTQIASTVTGYRGYTAGENGVPQSRELFWHFEKEAQIPFTVLCDFTAELYNEDTHTAKGTVTVAAGETVRYYATDGEKYIWLLLEDGTLCRKEVQMQEHRMMLDGHYAEEVFEGVRYAG